MDVRLLTLHPDPSLSAPGSSQQRVGKISEHLKEHVPLHGRPSETELKANRDLAQARPTIEFGDTLGDTNYSSEGKADQPPTAPDASTAPASFAESMEVKQSSEVEVSEFTGACQVKNEPRRLACPFHVLDPVKYSARGRAVSIVKLGFYKECEGPGFDSIPDLKYVAIQLRRKYKIDTAQVASG
jgi:hypothetical protein